VTVAANPMPLIIPQTVDEDPSSECDYGPTEFLPQPADPFSEPEPLPATNPVATMYAGQRTTPGRGWGRVHVAERHGWTSDHRRDTALALRFGWAHSAPDQDWPESDGVEYILPLPNRGYKCGRLVKIERAQRSDEPHPKGIITSYGVRLR
jgi:hypothetical protein